MSSFVQQVECLKQKIERFTTDEYCSLDHKEKARAGLQKDLNQLSGLNAHDGESQEWAVLMGMAERVGLQSL